MYTVQEGRVVAEKPRDAAIVGLIELEIAPFDPLTSKTLP